MLRDAFAHALDATTDMIRFGSMLEDLECYVDNSIVWSEDKGRIVGRRGGIRQWLRENAPDLSERYKTVMKYKALAKKFRQAVGVCDPIPAAAVLPPEQSQKRDDSEMARKRREEGRKREYCSNILAVDNGRQTGRKRLAKGTGGARGGRKGVVRGCREGIICGCCKGVAHGCCEGVARGMRRDGGEPVGTAGVDGLGGLRAMREYCADENFSRGWPGTMFGVEVNSWLVRTAQRCRRRGQFPSTTFLNVVQFAQ